MIGLGTWEAPISTFVFKGTGIMTISDLNGSYDFHFEIVGKTLPEIKVSNIVENGNTLTASGDCDALNVHNIPVTLTFDGDTFTGTIKAPLVGRIKVKGKRKAD